MQSQVRARSQFVSILAWIFIVMAGFATFVAILQNVMINAVFPIMEFGARCDAWLKRIYKQSASSLRFAKRAFRLAQNADFDERLAKVERLYLEELMKTDDANEGLNAFLEKRKPAWKGR